MNHSRNINSAFDIYPHRKSIIKEKITDSAVHVIMMQQIYIISNAKTNHLDDNYLSAT